MEGEAEAEAREAGVKEGRQLRRGEAEAKAGAEEGGQRGVGDGGEGSQHEGGEADAESEEAAGRFGERGWCGWEGEMGGGVGLVYAVVTGG